VGHRHDAYDVAFLVSRRCGLILAVRWFVNDHKERLSSDSALEILRQRYARGEIDKEEFENKKRDLS